MNPLATLKNKTTTFILPLVFDTSKHTEIITKTFKGSYIADFSKPEYDDFLLLIFDTDQDSKHIKKEAITSYDATDKIVKVYTIPDEILPDYFKVITGDYAALTAESKKKILDFWEEKEDSTLYNILYNKSSDDHEKDIKAKRVNNLLDSFQLAEEVFQMGVL